MNTFIEIPAGKNSISNRKLVFGVGVNDSNYTVTSRSTENKQIMCPFYKRWKGMIGRCYSSKFHEKQSTYKDCAVADEWLTFSVFKSWMINEDWQDKELDKDLLVPGNKIYSPDTCIFISPELNTLLRDCKSARGRWPIGVNFDKQSGKFRAQCNIKGKSKKLGRFASPEDASQTYRVFKSNHIKEIAKGYENNNRLYRSLLLHAKLVWTL